MLDLHDLVLNRLDFLSKLVRDMRIVALNCNDMGQRSVILVEHTYIAI